MRKPSVKRGVLKVVAGLAIVAASIVGLIKGSQLLVSGVQEIRLATSARYVGVWTFTHLDAEGEVVWQRTIHNALSDEGEQLLLETFFRAATAPTTFYVFLSDSSSPCSIAETDTLTAAATGEPSTNGYSRQEITRDSSGWPTSALDSGDWQVESSTETFSASGGSWGPVNCAGLSTTADNTGKHVAWAALSTSRTLADGESLQVSMDVKLQ